MSSADKVSCSLNFDCVIGTGAIGSGILFLLEGNHTLGRNESRLAVLSQAKDFAKLHIILHYITVFLKESCKRFHTYPLSLIGDDDIGRKLVRQLEETGMCIEGVQVKPGKSTLFSACFQYPDSSGGNITTAESASSLLTEENILSFMGGIWPEGRLLMLAAPEAPMAARIQLLKEGRKRTAFNVAAVLSSEVAEFIQSDGIGLTDLLALNIDEARSVCGIWDESVSSIEVVETCAKVLEAYNPHLALSITDGPNGSYLCKDGKIEQIPSFPTEVTGSAGAGDAYLSGTIVGLCHGLPLVKGSNDLFFGETPLQSAIELGTLFASFALTSIDSIHFGANQETLSAYIQQHGLVCSNEFLHCFEFVNTH